MTLLECINGPEDLKPLSQDQLTRLAGEIRDVLIETTTRTSGHLGPNLGVVELTIAIHRVFDSPKDKIVFDTGHQAYVHKLLTGRFARFGTLRQRGGLTGYPSRAESEHDLVENSHASTSLSYADGLAKAARGMLTQRDPAVLNSLTTIAVPSMVLVGADDTPFLNASDYMAAKIPGAAKAVIPDAGHAANIDQPESFNTAILGFLATLPPLPPPEWGGTDDAKRRQGGEG